MLQRVTKTAKASVGVHLRRQIQRKIFGFLRKVAMGLSFLLSPLSLAGQENSARCKDIFADFPLFQFMRNLPPQNPKRMIPLKEIQESFEELSSDVEKAAFARSFLLHSWEKLFLEDEKAGLDSPLFELSDALDGNSERRIEQLLEGNGELLMILASLEIAQLKIQVAELLRERKILGSSSDSQ